MRISARLLLSASLLCSCAVLHAQVHAEAPQESAELPPVKQKPPAVTREMTDPAAHTALKKLPPEKRPDQRRRFSTELEQEPGREISREKSDVPQLDEIRVYGRADPADFVAEQQAPMMKFRERLDRQRPLTPRDYSRIALCMLGLCANYGPEGIPVENTAFSRGERNAHRSTSDLATQFRGTIQ